MTTKNESFKTYNEMMKVNLTKQQKTNDNHSLSFNYDHLKMLQTQSQIFDYIKRMLKTDALSIDFIATISHRLLVHNAFSHYRNDKQLMKRAKAHYACDNRHTDQRFVKRNITLDNLVKR